MSTRPAEGALQASNNNLKAKVQGLEAQLAVLKIERDQARGETAAAAELKGEYDKKEAELAEALERCHAAEQAA